MCVQEDKRLKHEKLDVKHESVNLVTRDKGRKGKGVSKFMKNANVPMKRDGNRMHTSFARRMDTRRTVKSIRCGFLRKVLLYL